MPVIENDTIQMFIILYLTLTFVISMGLALWIQKHIKNKLLKAIVIGTGLFIPLLSVLQEGGPNVVWLRMNYEQGNTEHVIPFSNEEHAIIVKVSSVEFGSLGQQYKKYRMDLMHSENGELLNRITMPMEYIKDLTYVGKSNYLIWFEAEQWLAFDPFSGALTLDQKMITDKIALNNTTVKNKINKINIDKDGYLTVTTTDKKAYYVDLQDFSLSMSLIDKPIVDKIEISDEMRGLAENNNLLVNEQGR